MTTKKTTLNRIHREYGGRMVEFAGWELPVQYQSAIEEHHAVRSAVGVFDVSHMGQLEIRGRDALALAQKVTCNDVSRLSDGQAQYSALLTPEGTFIDDIVVYRFSDQRIFICVNAATTEKDFRWILDHAEGNVEVHNFSDSYCQLAVQGPRASSVLQKLTAIDLESIRFYWFTEGEVAGVHSIISRTGYTGEDGFELYCSPAQAEALWQQLFEAGQQEGIVPAGLAARNTLRLEMRYPLYGNDIDESTTPLEAGLSWIVKMEKGPFVGRDPLVDQKAKGLSRRLAGFQMVDPGIARDGYPICLDGRQVGKTTSGGFSPTLHQSIGLAYFPFEQSGVGQSLEIEIRGKRRRAEIVATPFYKRA